MQTTHYRDNFFLFSRVLSFTVVDTVIIMQELGLWCITVSPVLRYRDNYLG